MPTCGAVIQPIAVSVVSAASPLAAAAHAAMPPVTTSGRAGRAPGPDPARPGAAGDCGSSGSRAGGASAETLTTPILATVHPQPKQARRSPRRYGQLGSARQVGKAVKIETGGEEGCGEGAGLSGVDVRQATKASRGQDAVT